MLCNLQCEPGRLLVRMVRRCWHRVEMRRGRSLFINDGVYGNLAELKWIGPQFPARLIRPGQEPAAAPVPPSTFTVRLRDSIDSMPGPHWLPEDVIEGDWVEIGMTGAYSNSLGTDFNGMGKSSVVFVDDGAWYNEVVPATDENLQAVRVA
ncbi:MAG: hypothetical protein R3D03_01570 [Geminicoccaceae bacterium]